MATAPLNTIICPYGLVDEMVLTKSGALMGGMEVSGLDPQALSPADLEIYSRILRTIFSTADEDIVISQYYVHAKGHKVAIDEREEPRSELLSRRREKYLNQHRELSSSHLFYFMEVPPKSNVAELKSMEFVKHLAGFLTSKKSREFVLKRLKTKNAVLAFEEELARQKILLTTQIDEFLSKIQLVSEGSKNLNVDQMWSVFRGIFNLEPSYFESAMNEHVPFQNWDSLLLDGDIEHVNIKGQDLLKMNGAKPLYIKMGSAIGYGGEYTPSGIWANGAKIPVLQQGNYILMNRFRPFSTFQESMMFVSKENELERRQISIINAIKGNENQSVLEKQASTKPSIKKMIDDLDEAANVNDRYGLYSSHILLFDEDPNELINMAANMNSALTQAGLHLVWEKSGHTQALENFFPGAPNNYVREAVFTTSQLGACSHIYKSSQGLKSWGMHENEQFEPLYILESDDGVPFHYTPFIGGRCVVVGVGPIRSGKSFLKNTISTHFLKYGGYLRTIDIDQGSEPVAEFYGEDGGIFRIEDANSQGFNLFSSAKGENDTKFIAHFISQVGLMLKANDNPEMQVLTSEEQLELESSIRKVLALPKQLQSLKACAKHSSKGLQNKLSRFYGEGMYAHLVDCQEDAIDGFNKRVGAFNFQGIKEDKAILPVIMNETFYRIVELFEDPKYRHVPKYLDCDEFHNFKHLPGAITRIVKSVRTWGKMFGGIGMWSQSPQEFLDIPDWPAIRSAATTFFFMSDPGLDEELYRETFKLTDGEIEAIKKLIPKKQAYIIQREIGVSKTVNVSVEAEQYVINTSNPYESSIRREMREKYPDADVYIQKTIEALGLKET